MRYIAGAQRPELNEDFYYIASDWAKGSHTLIVRMGQSRGRLELEEHELGLDPESPAFQERYVRPLVDQICKKQATATGGSDGAA